MADPVQTSGSAAGADTAKQASRSASPVRSPRSPVRPQESVEDASAELLAKLRNRKNKIDAATGEASDVQSNGPSTPSSPVAVVPKGPAEVVNNNIKNNNISKEKEHENENPIEPTKEEVSTEQKEDPEAIIEQLRKEREELKSQINELKSVVDSQQGTEAKESKVGKEEGAEYNAISKEPQQQPTPASPLAVSTSNKEEEEEEEEDKEEAVVDDTPASPQHRLSQTENKPPIPSFSPAATLARASQTQPPETATPGSPPPILPKKPAKKPGDLGSTQSLSSGYHADSADFDESEIAAAGHKKILSESAAIRGGASANVEKLDYSPKFASAVLEPEVESTSIPLDDVTNDPPTFPGINISALVGGSTGEIIDHKNAENVDFSTQELPLGDSQRTSGTTAHRPAPTPNVADLGNTIVIIKNSILKFNQKRGKEALLFVVDLYNANTNEFKYSIAKSFNQFVALNESILAEQPSLLMKLSRLPDKTLFLSNAPSKSYLRKTYLEAWLQNVVAVCENSHSLNEFMETDKYVPEQKLKRLDVVQEGYVFKKAKGAGNWKMRYFLLRESGCIDYYENEHEVGSGHRATIKLKHSVIIYDPEEVEKILDSGIIHPEEKVEFENSLILTEYKKAIFQNANEPIPVTGNEYLLLAENKIESRHVICTEDNEELMTWIKNISDVIAASRELPQKAKSKEKAPPKNEKASQLRNAISAPISGPISTPVTSVNLPSDEKLKPVQIPESAQAFVPTSTADKRHGGISMGLPIPGLNATSPLGGLGKTGTMRTNTIKGIQFNVQDENQRALEQKMPPTLKALGGGVEFKGGDNNNNGKKLHRLFGKKKDKSDKHIFGLKLEQAVALYHIRENFECPIVIYRCIEFIEFRKAEEEEGIYRLSGSSSAIQGLKEKFNTEGDVDICNSEKFYDINTVASLLKLYLRELPDPILTIELQKAFMKMIEVVDKDERLDDLKNLLNMLPLPNYTLLKVLCGHLLRVVKHQDVNKMTLKNIGIVFSPTLGVPAGIFSLLLSEYWHLFTWDGSEESRPPVFAKDSEDAYDIIVSHTGMQKSAEWEVQNSQELGDSMNLLPSAPLTLSEEDLSNQ